MNGKVSVGTRLRQLMSERGLKQVDILNKTIPLQSQYNIGIAKNDLSQYVNDKVEPNQERIFVLSKALGVTEPWLMGFDVPMTVDEETQKIPFKTVESIELPYLGTVSAGGFELPAEASEMIAVPNNIIKENSSNYFVLKTNGDSMNREIANGHFVIVRDVRKSYVNIKNGDIVIFKNGNEYTMKRVMKTDTMVYLEPDSYLDGFSTQSFEIGGDCEIEIIGKVVYSFKEYE